MSCGGFASPRRFHSVSKTADASVRGASSCCRCTSTRRGAGRTGGASACGTRGVASQGSPTVSLDSTRSATTWSWSRPSCTVIWSTATCSVDGDAVTAIFDWGCAFAGDFLYDVATILFWTPWYSALNDVDLLTADARAFRGRRRRPARCHEAPRGMRSAHRAVAHRVQRLPRRLVHARSHGRPHRELHRRVRLTPGPTSPLPEHARSRRYHPGATPSPPRCEDSFEESSQQRILGGCPTAAEDGFHHRACEP